MEKVGHASKTLGGRGQQSKIDNSWLSEFGWGKHTLETGYVRCGLLGNHCAVCCSDAVLILIMIANPDDAMSNLTRAHKKEETYVRLMILCRKCNFLILFD